MSGVQVGVRVRPFLPKLDGKDECCVSMTDTETTVIDTADSQAMRRFTFDFSFWSHDGFDTLQNGYQKPKEGS